MKFSLGSIEFASKQAALTEVRSILHKSPEGQRLEGRAQEVVKGLLDRHPNRHSKSEKGVVGICSRQIEYRRGIFQRCFFIQHPDGSETDFSIHVAFGRTKPYPTFESAARHAVADTLHGFKCLVFGSGSMVRCGISGEFVLFKNAHVDHAPPWTFARILAEFDLRFGMPLVRDSDDGLRVVFARNEDRESFCRVHDELATLRVVSAKANMSAGSHSGLSCLVVDLNHAIQRNVAARTELTSRGREIA